MKAFKLVPTPRHASDSLIELLSEDEAERLAAAADKARPSLSHFSGTLLGKIRSVRQLGSGWGDHKPGGFWLSVDGEDDWKAWCEAEEFHLGSLAHRYRVTLTDPELLLWITTPAELLEFTERYDKPVALGTLGARPGRYIDWPRVASDCPGIVIAPYQWGLRLDQRTNWYYSWDCASGCIWDASAIASTELLAADESEPEPEMRWPVLYSGRDEPDDHGNPVRAPDVDEQ